MELLRRIYLKSLGIRREYVALYFAFGDSYTPWYAKLSIILTFVYLFSPFDIIPDFIPLLGFVDDLVIVPLLVRFSIKMIPENVMAKNRAKADSRIAKLKRSIIESVVIVFLWVFAGIIVVRYLILFIKGEHVP